MVRALQILFPLYIPPSGCSGTGVCNWQPLYDVIHAYPALQFNVIVNPASGPGPSGSLPDVEYKAGISALNAYPNARTIGYIASHNGTKPALAYQDEIKTYSGWSSYRAANIAVHGIFIDETNTDTAKIPYFSNFSTAIHKTFGDNALVVHNPGVITPQAFFNAIQKDVFVTFENFYNKMWVSDTIFTTTNPTYKNTPHERQAAILHNFNGSIPTDLVNVTDTVGELYDMKYIYITDQPEYNTSSTILSRFAASVNGTNTFMSQHPEWFPRA
ncbi:hypothetical protein EXIGLDRAFT_95092 [Exidia glandulosa HHB12029]|uniref:Spherulation-specific family 4 n=1 Tax=Exidia glandulosa HHB12029 TaxID=1314781 RepID=A0A165H792_EXIGL|nr:hypothetical protein EXIGLDRAFT_95092 [Exidia glandulosa HHB12029]